MINLALISLATLSISYTIGRGAVFERFRIYLLDKGFFFLYELFSCPYCISHWIAFILTVIYRPNIINYFYPLDICVESAVVVGLVLLLLKVVD